MALQTKQKDEPDMEPARQTFEASVERRFREIADLFNKNHAGLADLKREVRALRRRTDQQFEQVDQRMRSFDTRLRGIEATTQSGFETVIELLAEIDAKL